MISARAKAGLEAVKARGVTLGTNKLKPEPVHEASTKSVAVIKRNADAFAAKVLPIVQVLNAQHGSLRKLAVELGCLGVQTARGKRWTTAERVS